MSSELFESEDWWSCAGSLGRARVADTARLDRARPAHVARTPSALSPRSASLDERRSGCCSLGSSSERALLNADRMRRRTLRDAARRPFLLSRFRSSRPLVSLSLDLERCRFTSARSPPIPGMSRLDEDKAFVHTLVARLRHYHPDLPASFDWAAHEAGMEKLRLPSCCETRLQRVLAETDSPRRPCRRTTTASPTTSTGSCASSSTASSSRVLHGRVLGPTRSGAATTCSCRATARVRPVSVALRTDLAHTFSPVGAQRTSPASSSFPCTTSSSAPSSTSSTPPPSRTGRRRPRTTRSGPSHRFWPGPRPSCTRHARAPLEVRCLREGRTARSEGRRAAALPA